LSKESMCPVQAAMEFSIVILADRPLVTF